MTLVSIIIPTYNYGKYINYAIESVLSQASEEVAIEVVIADDGSTDNTEELIKALHNRDIFYYKQLNKGKANATANAISKCNGEYIFNLDADDCFLPGKIGETIRIYNLYPEVVHVSSPALCINEKDNSKYIEPIPHLITNKFLNGSELLEFFYENKALFGGGSTFSARSSVLKKINIPDGVDMFIDEYLLLATLPHGGSYFIDQPLSVWRIHGENYSGNKKGLQRLKKNERLLKSSESVLYEMNALCLSSNLKNNYKLQHEVRKLAFKEEAGEKSLKDILLFCFFVFKSNYSLKILKRYSVFSRFIPTPILSWLKP